MLLKDMVFDGRYPNMRVHPDWFEPKDPLDYAPRVDDPVALWRPAPDNWHLTPPVLTLVDQDHYDVDLAWTAASSDAEQIEYYSVYLRLKDADTPWVLLQQFLVTRDMFGEITSETLALGLTTPTNELYEFMVAATDSGGLSGNSNEVQMAEVLADGPRLIDHDIVVINSEAGKSYPAFRASLLGRDLIFWGGVYVNGTAQTSTRLWVDGVEYTTMAIDTQFGFVLERTAPMPNEWWNGVADPVASDWQIRITPNFPPTYSGFPTYATSDPTIYGVWTNLSLSFQTWLAAASDSGEASLTTSYDVQIRRASDQVVVAQGTWTIRIGKTF
jgi:hypothetical protein